MRGENQLDVKVYERDGRIDRVLGQQPGGLGQRLALHRPLRVVAAATAQALTLLGDVGDLQLQRAGADDRLQLVFRQRVQPGEQHLGRALLALAHAGGGRVQPRHRVGEAVPHCSMSTSPTSTSSSSSSEVSMWRPR